MKTKPHKQSIQIAKGRNQSASQNHIKIMIHPELDSFFSIAADGAMENQDAEDPNPSQNLVSYLSERGISALNVARPTLVHSGAVMEVTKRDVMLGAPRVCDALVTNEEGLYLSMLAGDCPIVYLYVPYIGKLKEQRCIALIHAGWRGITQNIIADTITTLKKFYGVYPRAIRALVSPGIQRCCFEVRKDAYNLLMPFSGDYRPYFEGQRNTIDLQAIIVRQLVLNGIQNNPGHISVSLECTACKKNVEPEGTYKYFSWRRSHTRNRMVAVLGMKPRLSDNSIYASESRENIFNQSSDAEASRTPVQKGTNI